MSDFQNSAVRKTQIDRAAARGIDEHFLKELLAFNQTLPASTARDRNLESLKSGKSVAVITGQQVGLFLGPIFTLYKALSAVSLAGALETESGVKTVPIFWLQSEDHDFLEINHTALPDPNGSVLKLELPDDRKLERVSVKHRLLGPEVTPLVTRLIENLKHFPHAQPILDVIGRNYRPERNMVDAFRDTIAEILSAEGLIFFDPREGRFERFIQPVFSEALNRYAEIEESLSAQGKLLAAAGHEVQVYVRENSPLFFFHEKDRGGPRYRLTRSGSDWHEIGGKDTISDKALREALESSPGRFSSSALLRPLLQDRLFPTAAYVGGPAEERYFAQIEPLYPIFNLDGPPLVVPRASFLCLERKVVKWLGDLEITSSDLKQSDSELYKILAAKKGTVSPQKLEEEVLSNLDLGLAKMNDVFAKIDTTLVQSLEKTRAKIAQSIALLTARYTKALATKDQVSIERVARLRNLLFPDGVDQERFYGPIYYFCRYGGKFKENILRRIEPLKARENNIVELSLDDEHA